MDLYTADFFADPYPTFDRLRQHASPAWSENARAYVAAGYEHCAAILVDSDRFADTDEDGSAQSAGGSGRHHAFRLDVSRGLSPEVVDLESATRDAVDDLVGALAGMAGADFMVDLADPLATRVLGRLLGVPPDERSTFAAWAAELTRGLDGDSDGEQYGRVAVELSGYLAYRLASESRPSGNLLAHVKSSGWNGVQAISLCNQVVVAARDLTVGLLGNCLNALLLHPEQRALVLADPGLLDAAIEESLRWDAPVLGQARVAVTDALVGDTRVPAGSTVLVMFAAANHDPAVFRAPGEFDVRRPNSHRHLGFGRGARYCLGAGLARLETKLLLRALFARYPDVRLDPSQPPSRRPPGRMVNLRAFRSLPILLGTSTRSGRPVDEGTTIPRARQAADSSWRSAPGNGGS